MKKTLILGLLCLLMLMNSSLKEEKIVPLSSSYNGSYLGTEKDDFVDDVIYPSNFLTNLKIGEKLGYRITTKNSFYEFDENYNYDRWIMYKILNITSLDVGINITVKEYSHKATNFAEPEWASAFEWWDESVEKSFIVDYQYLTIINGFVLPRDMNMNLSFVNALISAMDSCITYSMNSDLDIFEKIMANYNKSVMDQCNNVLEVKNEHGFSGMSVYMWFGYNNTWDYEYNPNYNCSLRSDINYEFNYRNILALKNYTAGGSWYYNNLHGGIANVTIAMQLTEKLYYQSNPMITEPTIIFYETQITPKSNLTFQISDIDMGTNPYYLVYSNCSGCNHKYLHIIDEYLPATLDNSLRSWVSGNNNSVPLLKYNSPLGVGFYIITIEVGDDMGNIKEFSTILEIIAPPFEVPLWVWVGLGIGGIMGLIGIFKRNYRIMKI